MGGGDRAHDGVFAVVCVHRAGGAEALPRQAQSAGRFRTPANDSATRAGRGRLVVSSITRSGCGRGPNQTAPPGRGRPRRPWPTTRECLPHGCRVHVPEGVTAEVAARAAQLQRRRSSLPRPGSAVRHDQRLPRSATVIASASRSAQVARRTSATARPDTLRHAAREEVRNRLQEQPHDRRSAAVMIRQCEPLPVSTPKFTRAADHHLRLRIANAVQVHQLGVFAAPDASPLWDT